MNIAIRIAAAILSVPPDVLAPMVPMMAPPPRNLQEIQLREEIDTALSGRCCSASTASTSGVPAFALSDEESHFVDCHSGLPSLLNHPAHDDGSDGSEGSDGSDGSENSDGARPSTYGEITILGARQLFHHMGLTSIPSETATINNDENDIIIDNPNYQLFDLGSGGGRLVIQSHLELPHLSKSVGIELSPTRHAIAHETWDRLVQNGDAERIRSLARKAWGLPLDKKKTSEIELLEGDLFELDISQATNIYVSSLCFSEVMLEKLVDKIETEGESLKILASLRLLPLASKQQHVKHGDGLKKRIVELGRNPWMEFIEMSWTKARGDGCPVYFYNVRKLN